MGFESLLGNERLKENLQSSINRGRISHFYLISGPEGAGKHTLARLLGAAILCKSADKPCGVCPSCRKALGSGHPDLITVDDPEKKTVPAPLSPAIQGSSHLWSMIFATENASGDRQKPSLPCSRSTPHSLGQILHFTAFPPFHTINYSTQIPTGI